LYLLAEALKDIEYEIIRCSNGRQAIDQMKRQPVDLLITDIVMPEQDGLETIKAARKLLPQLEILAVTAHGGDNYLNVARLMGASQTLAKPIEANVLQETVRAMLDS
jgi:DNA-binding response OmpR family regulator